jgi:guanylate kinase
MSGLVIVISGPSGVGKDTLVQTWRERDPSISRVVTYTTRAPRAGEENGVSYHFVDLDTFRQMEAEGCFLESKFVHGNYYASPLAGIKALIEEGKTVVLVIDVQGAIVAMEKLPEVETVFILPPSEEALVERLSGRGTESDADRERRLANAIGEIAMADRYKHQVVNDDVELAVAELARIKREALT